MVFATDGTTERGNWSYSVLVLRTGSYPNVRNDSTSPSKAISVECDVDAGTLADRGEFFYDNCSF